MRWLSRTETIGMNSRIGRCGIFLLYCLDPNSYAASQSLGLTLLTGGAAGIVYPSVHHKDGVCIACFRPPLVLNVQEGPMVTLTFIDARITAYVVED
jgi:RES domain